MGFDWKSYFKLKKDMDLGAWHPKLGLSEASPLTIHILYSLSRFTTYSDISEKTGKSTDEIGPTLGSFLAEMKEVDGVVSNFSRWFNLEEEILSGENPKTKRKEYFLYYRKLKNELEGLEKEKLIKSYSYKEWCDEFRVKPKIEKGSGNSTFYRITGKGVLYYELALTLPSLGPAMFFRFGLFMPDFAQAYYKGALELLLLRIGILSDEHRTKWTWDFISKYQPPINRATKKISDEFEEACSKSKTSIYDCGLETLILQELAFFNELSRLLKIQISSEEASLKKSIGRTEINFYIRSRRAVDCEATKILGDEIEHRKKFLLGIIRRKTNLKKLHPPEIKDLIRTFAIKAAEDMAEYPWTDTGRQ